MFPVDISGERVRLREWRAGDAEAMHRWIGDADVMRHLTWGTGSLAETEDYLTSVLVRQRHDPRTDFFLAIETVAEATVIGDAGFTWVGPASVEIGYFLERRHWGKGLGLEAADLIIKLASELGAQSIAATCFKDNWRSERIMTACGMTRQPHADPRVLRYSRTTTARHKR